MVQQPVSTQWVIAIVFFLMGMTAMNLYCRIAPPAPLEETSCLIRCKSAVSIALTLWPSLEIPLRVARVIPDTAKACENACTVKKLLK